MHVLTALYARQRNLVSIPGMVKAIFFKSLDGLWEGGGWPSLLINLLTPNVNYSGRTAPLTSKVVFYIFIQQI